MSTDDQFTDEDHERALRAGRHANAAATGTRPDSGEDHAAAGYITLGVILAVIGTLGLIFLHVAGLVWIGAIACLARGIRLARKG